MYIVAVRCRLARDPHAPRKIMEEQTSSIVIDWELL